MFICILTRDQPSSPNFNLRFKTNHLGVKRQPSTTAPTCLSSGPQDDLDQHICICFLDSFPTPSLWECLTETESTPYETVKDFQPNYNEGKQRVLTEDERKFWASCWPTQPVEETPATSRHSCWAPSKHSHGEVSHHSPLHSPTYSTV